MCFYSKKIYFYATFLLLICLNLSANKALAASQIYPPDNPHVMGTPILNKDTKASIYDEYGRYIYGKKIPDLPMNIIKYRKQNYPAGYDVTINGNISQKLGEGAFGYIFSNGQDYDVGSTVRLKNVGLDSKGRKVVVCMQSKSPVVYSIQNSTGRIYVAPFKEGSTFDVSYNIWFETEQGEKINNKNSYFLFVGLINAYDNGDPMVDKSYQRFSRYVIQSGEDSYLIQNQNAIRQFLIPLGNGFISEFQPVKYGDRAFNIIFKQNETISFTAKDFDENGKELYLNKKGLVTPLYLLAADQLVVMSIPMPTPYLNSTRNESGVLEARLDAVQEIPIQDGKNFYPDQVKVTVTLPETIDLEQINEKYISIETSSGQKIPASLKIKDKNKIEVIADSRLLEKFKGEEIHIKGNLPLNINYPGLLDNVDKNGYIIINDIFVKNENSKESNTNTLYVKKPKEQKIPAPYITQTRNNREDLVVALDVTQEIPKSDNEQKWPSNFNYTIDLPDTIDSKNIDKGTMTLKDENNVLGSLPISDFVTYPSQNKISVNLNEQLLNLLGTGKKNKLRLTCKLPLNFKYPNLFDNKDSQGYLKIENIYAQNNVNPKRSTELLYTKTNPPTADTKPITVPLGSKSSDLNINDYVYNVKSHYRNDKVNVNFSEEKKFDKIEKTKIGIKLTSQNTGDYRIIYSDVDVIDYVDKLISDPNHINTDISNNYYETTIQQKLDCNETYLNSLSIFIESPETIDLNKKDFSIYAIHKNQETENLIDPSNYNIQMNEHNLAEISFKNDVLDKYKDGNVVIKQKSSLNKENSEILKNVLDKEKDSISFEFQGKVYNEIDKSIKSKVISFKVHTRYIMKITADPVENKIVKVNSTIGEAKDYIEKISKPEFTFDRYDIEFKEKPNFSIIGLQKFNVIIKSKYFNTFIEVPISIRVVNSSVNMSIKQVYRMNNKMPIYSDVVNKTPVDNSKNTYEVTSGESISDTLKEIPSKDFKINYSAYVPTFNSDYKIVIDGNKTTSTTVPNKDFTLILEYDGTVELKADNLDFGNIPISLVNLSKTKIQKNKYVTLTDTTLINKTEIQVSLLNPLFNPDKKQDFLGGLFIQQTPKPLYITTKGQTFYETPANEEKQMYQKLPMNMGIYQNLGNSDGNYEGKVLWSVIDGPSN